MKKHSPYSIILSRRVTEKSNMLQNLESTESNPSVARCTKPKAVFLVHPDANKAEIKDAIEEIYRERSLTVTKVNTINGKRKQRRLRGRAGYRSAYKKAIITLEAGDRIETV